MILPPRLDTEVMAVGFFRYSNCYFVYLIGLNNIISICIIYIYIYALVGTELGDPWWRSSGAPGRGQQRIVFECLCFVLLMFDVVDSR